MKLKSIEVQAYRSIRGLSVSFDPHLVMIGKNNHGKTNLIKAIDTLLSLPGHIEPDDFPSVKFRSNNRPMDTVLRAGFNLPHDSELNKYLRKKLRRSGESFFIKLTANRKDRIANYDFEFAGRRAWESRKDILSHLREALKEELTFIWIPSFRGMPSNGESYAKEYISILLETIFKFETTGRKSQLEKSYIALEENCMKLIEKVEKSLGEVGKQYLQMSGLEILPTFASLGKFLQDIDFVVSDGISKVSLTQKGTGWQSAFILMLLQYIGTLSKSMDAIFAVEEPEAFLHAGGERQVIDAVRRLMDNSQVIITTHSNVIVDEIEKNEWNYLRRIEKRSDGTYIYPTKALTEKERNQYCLYCDSTFAEILFSDGVIFTEGPSDEFVLRYILRKATKIKGNITIAAMRSSTMLTYYRNYSNNFNIKNAFMLDVDAIVSNTKGRENIAHFIKLIGRADTQETRRFIDETRNIAIRECTSEPQITKRCKELNKRLNRYGIFILPVDIEYSVISSRNREGVIEILRKHQIIKSGERELSVEELRKRIGSKGPNQEWNESGKRRYIPREIVAETPLENLEDNFMRIIKLLRQYFAV